MRRNEGLFVPVAGTTRPYVMTQGVPDTGRHVLRTGARATFEHIGDRPFLNWIAVLVALGALVLGFSRSVGAKTATPARPAGSPARGVRDCDRPSSSVRSH